jgi:hypothetical protein
MESQGSRYLRQRDGGGGDGSWLSATRNIPVAAGLLVLSLLLAELSAQTLTSSLLAEEPQQA